MLAGRDPHLFNQSQAKRDYVNVHDIKELLTLMMLSPRHYCGEIFNVCSGTGHSVPEIVEHLGAILNAQITPKYRNPEEYWEKYESLHSGTNPLSRQRIVNEVYKNSIGCPQKTKEEFGFLPKVDFAEGLAMVVAHGQELLASGKIK